MRMVGATNANRGATDADGNKCSKRGATNARLGVRESCLGARHVGDLNTKWRWQGVLGGAHNLLENGMEQRETSQKSVLKE